MLITVKHIYKRAIIGEARMLASMGFELIATDGTHKALTSAGLDAQRVNKVHEGRPHIVDMIKNRELDLLLNTPAGKQQRYDDSAIRAAAISVGIPCVTTLAGIRMVVSALDTLQREELSVRSLQKYHAELRPHEHPIKA